MAFPDKYQFYITNGSDYFYVDNAGAVANTPTPTPLVYAPANWDEVSITFERGWTYYGLFRQYSSEFQFVKDGATILRWAYYLVSGIETELQLVIKKFNPTIGIYAYEDYISCEFDMSTFNDTFDSVSVSLIQGGFLTKLKARENTLYPIEVQNNAEVVWVKMDGIKLDAILNWGVTTDTFPQTFTIGYIPLAYFEFVEGTNLSLYPQNVDPPTAQNLFVTNISAVSVDIDLNTILNFAVTMDPGNAVNGTVYLRITLYDMNPYAFVSKTDIFSQSGLAPGSVTTINVDQIDTITIPANHALEFSVMVDNGGGGGGGANNYQVDIGSECKLIVEYSAIATESYIPALRSKKVFDTLVSEISDALTTPASTLLDTTYVDQVITCGNALRLQENSIMKISFTDFYNSINGVFSASLYYDMPNDTVYLEDKVFVFPSATLIADIGAVNNVIIKQLTNEIFSKLKMGFGSYTYDEINGKDEFNQVTEYLSPITRTQSDKDLTSVIRADMYGIEYTRINLTNRVSTDADSDNDNFFLHINNVTSGNIPDGLPGAGEPYYELFRTPIDLNPGPNYWNIENLVHPDTAYNIFFSAKRALARWGNYISSLLFLQDANLIKFQVTTKDNIDGTKLKTSEGDPVVEIDESANQFVADYLPQLFYPILFEVNFADTTTLATLIGSDPHGFIQFQYKGNTFEGFIIKLTTKPKLQTQTATLLATTNNDLSKIVYP